MFSNFTIIEPLFEDQANELHQFTLVIDEQEYTGILEDNEITWYHPQPQTVLDEQQVEEMEKEVLKLLQQKLK